MSAMLEAFTLWCLCHPGQAQAVHLDDHYTVCTGLLCLPSGTPLPLVNGNFSDDSGETGDSGFNGTSPLGWTVSPAADGKSAYLYGPVYGNGFQFGASGVDDDIVSQRITVQEGCRYQVLYTLTSLQESPNEFHPTINEAPLLDAEGGSLEVVDLPAGTTNDYVGVFTAEADLVTLSFAGQDVDSYVVLVGVEVLAL